MEPTSEQVASAVAFFDRSVELLKPWQRCALTNAERERLFKQGTMKPPKPKERAKHRRWKSLPLDMRRAMHKMRADGAPYNAIAVHFDLPPMSVTRWLVNVKKPPRGWLQWTPEELEKLKELHATGMTYGQIAKVMNAGKHNVEFTFRRLGLRRNKTRRAPIAKSA